MSVNLKAKPYYLSDSQIQWVEDTISSMTLEEKIQQLFFILTAENNEDYLKKVTAECKFGGARYNPGSPEQILSHNKTIQETTKIPCLIAANTESGGNGACRGGTEVGNGTKIGSTHNPELAYQMGYISALEAKQIGVNTLFAPIVDIHHDFHNPVISYKCFGNNPEIVSEMSLQFLKGVQDVGLIACAKHFPGDGYDERDQHLAPSINPLSCEEWDKSFGMVYSSLIDAGLPMIMVGHITLPSYEKKFNPDIQEYMPATLSREVVTDLLKGKLGFNGLVTTDATHMVALTCAMKRKDLLPRLIQAGCDMILFYNDYDEDISFMMDGYRQGIITDERLTDALRRILGVKCMLGFDKKHGDETIGDVDLSLIGCPAHQKVAKEVSKEGITLVKQEEGLLPLDKNKIRKILIVPQHDANPFAFMMPKGIPTIYDYIKSRLQQEGFEVEIFKSLMEKAKESDPKQAMYLVGNVYNFKTPIASLTENYDLIIHVMDFDSHNTVQRALWQMSKGTPDVPWYVHEVPTIMVSVRCPFHLFDAPQVKTYINAYDKNKSTLDSLVDKLVGKEDFEGVSPVDAFCNMKY